MYKEKTNSSTNKCLKDLNKKFTSEETRIANKHEKIKNTNNQENANFLRYRFWIQAHIPRAA